MRLPQAPGAGASPCQYNPYGKLQILDANFTADSDNVSDVDWEHTITGRQFDAESGLYQFRNRFYDGSTGRFVNRDPLGYVDGANVNRNGFTPDRNDPHGFQPAPKMPPRTWIPRIAPGTGGVVGTAGTCAAADGPLPIGDAIGGGILIGGAIDYFARPITGPILGDVFDWWYQNPPCGGGSGTPPLPPPDAPPPPDTPPVPDGDGLPKECPKEKGKTCAERFPHLPSCDSQGPYLDVDEAIGYEFGLDYDSRQPTPATTCSGTH